MSMYIFVTEDFDLIQRMDFDTDDDAKQEAENLIVTMHEPVLVFVLAVYVED